MKGKKISAPIEFQFWFLYYDFYITLSSLSSFSNVFFSLINLGVHEVPLVYCTFSQWPSPPPHFASLSETI